MRYGYWIKCHDYKTDDSGRVIEVHCTYDSETKGGNPPSDGRKVKGTLHWVPQQDAAEYEILFLQKSTIACFSVEVRIYDRLFTTVNPDDVPEGKSWRDFINPKSLQVSCE